MARKRERTYEDYLELGFLLLEAQEVLHAVRRKATETVPAKDVDRVMKVSDRLDSVRSAIDTAYCREVFSRDVPEGYPRYPVYMQRWLEEHPEERQRLAKRTRWAWSESESQARRTAEERRKILRRYGGQPDE